MSSERHYVAANVFFGQRQYFASHQAASRAVSAYEAEGNKRRICEALLIYGRACNALGHYAQAAKTFRNALLALACYEHGRNEEPALKALAMTAAGDEIWQDEIARLQTKVEELSRAGKFDQADEACQNQLTFALRHGQPTDWNIAMIKMTMGNAKSNRAFGVLDQEDGTVPEAVALLEQSRELYDEAVKIATRAENIERANWVIGLVTEMRSEVDEVLATIAAQSGS